MEGGRNVTKKKLHLDQTRQMATDVMALLRRKRLERREGKREMIQDTHHAAWSASPKG